MKERHTHRTHRVHNSLTEIGISSSKTTLHIFEMIHSYAWCDLFISVTWLICTCHYVIRTTLHIRDIFRNHSFHPRPLCIYVIWLIYICNVTHLYAWHDSFIHNMTNKCVLCTVVPSALVTWLIHICNVTHLYAWGGSFIHTMTNKYVLSFLLHHFAHHRRAAFICSTHMNACRRSDI